MRRAMIILMCFAIPYIGYSDNKAPKTAWSLPIGAKTRIGKGSVDELKFSPDGTRLAAASSIGIWIYDVSTGKEIDLFTGHTRSVESVSFSPDGMTLASGSWDKTIRLWDTITGRHLKTLTGHTSYVASVSFSPDGMTLASGGLYQTIRLWDVATGKHLKTLMGHTRYVASVSFSPDGMTLASGSWDKTIRLWDTITGRHLKTLTGHTDKVASVSFSPWYDPRQRKFTRPISAMGYYYRQALENISGHTSSVESPTVSHQMV